MRCEKFEKAADKRGEKKNAYLYKQPVGSKDPSTRRNYMKKCRKKDVFVPFCRLRAPHTVKHSTGAQRQQQGTAGQGVRSNFSTHSQPLCAVAAASIF